ncbi:hypothetical protein SODALDRAFT_270204 [Sodiomyces alkalinus F11]|uniref:Karyogamy protein n=1 Tax=Sodiomyces alkalinus (strain CBS 110278 / VKM F-3762 / F11) TaxID=1314773 RepID=A0A3N2Q649_SODAK|nr:hypothetical protein SODALDRAFT_270204 [Sodiomyces alkalinus F11]ROT42254.1 hypothetical protein SODALDRAFT_270204 [Sodiomyces alkalinus F11]
MTASAEFSRLSFGAGNTLDLSFNLPAPVLLPPSTLDQSTFVPGSKDADRSWEDSSDSDASDDLPDAGREPTEHTGEIRAVPVTIVRPPREGKAEEANHLSHQNIRVGKDNNEDHDEGPSEDAAAQQAAGSDAEKTPTTSEPPRIPPPRDPRRAVNQVPTAHSNVPLHPIPSMQGAFAESLLEVTDGKPASKPKVRFGDAKARREELISQERDEELYSANWRYRPGQQQHELHKLMAQISFGVYLLLNGMANSTAQVVNILQGHIDEVDEFLEVAMEDLQEASTDLQERIDYLRLPMENIDVFEKLLEDRNFRLQIVEGNEKIEHIIARTNILLGQYDKDVQQGLTSARDFALYLAQQKDGTWRRDRPDVLDIYEAMKGNTEGWFNAFADMEARGKEVNTLVMRLTQIVAEISSKAGEVSRRTWTNIPPFTIPLQEISTEAECGSNSRVSSSRASSASGDRSTIRADSPHGFASAPSITQPNPESTHYDVPLNKAESPMLSFPKPPTHLSPRLTRNPSQSSFSESIANSDAYAGSDAVVEDSPLFILQPRTYTPQPPEPLPSPMVRDRERERPTLMASRSEQNLAKKTSLRQRVSLKTTPPESIQIPQPHPAEFERPTYASRQSPDSAYGSDDQRPRYSALADMSPPIRPPVMASPRSDQQQFYRPVQASPHSPLQQRPLTAGAAPRPLQSQTPPPMYRPGHQRNAPSRMGGASMLSTVTTMTYDSQTVNGDKKLKKKRSALGWLKKAFSLDEEERMIYEARKQQQAPDPYYEGRSPKYIDGKRVR